MASESSADDPGTPNNSQPIAESVTTPTTQPADDEVATASSVVPQDPPFPFYPSQDGVSNGGLPHDNTNADSAGGGGMGVSVPYPPMPVYPYGNVMSGPPPMTRPKRTQCKNACTNCQKACKKCDDNRPCQRCIRYGTTETCVDSKRKERRKGVKRGPYKKRDSKGSNASVDNDDGSGIHSANTSHGLPPNMPYVGPVGYPPGMWSSYIPTGPNGKLESGTYYQPVFALTPVGGQPPHGGDGESTGGGSEAPHFPVGFYPATFISYPGPYPPYAIPQGGTPQGFHYPYPPPGLFQPRVPHTNQGSATTDQSTSSSSVDANAKSASGSSTTVESDKSNKGDDKGTDADPQVNRKAKVVEPKVDDVAMKKTE